MKRTGTNGLPPGHSIPNGHLDGSIPRPTPTEPSLGTSIRTTEQSPPASTPGPQLDMAKPKTDSPQSIAMKRKWASGEMADVGRKAAETKRLNAERRLSAITPSDNSTPEPAFTSSAPVSGASKKSLGDYARQRDMATAQTPERWKPSQTPDTRASDSPSVAQSASPQPGTAEAALFEQRSWDTRPTILPPKKKARMSPEPTVPRVPVTPFAKSLLGRAYDMVPDQTGRLVHGFGALFPDGYAPLPDPNAKGPRWICPVKTCTHEKTYLKSHGWHFMTAHRTCLLNDNQDGTFSIEGYDPGLDAPMVVLREPAGGTALGRTTGVSTPARTVSNSNGTVVEESPALPNHGYQPYLDAPSGRSYMTYPDGAFTAGTIIPDGYERLLAAAEADKPCVCPIKHCLQGFQKREGLTIHFARMHGGRILNDNLDGTLTVLGHRDDDVRFQNISGTKHKDALVVRQSTMTLAEEKAAAANVANKELTKRLLHLTPSIPPTPVVQPSASPAPASSQAPGGLQSTIWHTKHYLTPANESNSIQDLEGGALEIWNYIRPYLSQFTECPDTAWIPDLIKLPKVRDIVWNEAYIDERGFVDKVSREIATMIIQLTGEVPERVCSCCRDGKGPYGECIVISSKAPIDARLKFYSCAACIYNGLGTRCTLKERNKRKAEEDLKNMARRQQQKQEPTEEQQDSPGVDLPLSSLTEEQCLDRVKALSAVRRSERVQVQAAQAQTSRTESPDDGNHEDIVMADEEEDMEAVPRPPASHPTRATRNNHTHNHARHPQPNPTPTSHLALEDWELAPGHIPSESSAPDQLPEAIFFSHSYLSAGRAVRMHPDVSVRNYVVNSGSSVRWPATEGMMRIVTVGAGKVKVRITGEEDVDVGPHGAFRVVPGRGCVVFNKLYGDAVLVVTEVADY
ncbi:hypothetical protein GE09DRAFT_1061573 [Coniochaeta sp. 2T2.1]|nr:hypothetical protein GE09DRAFT_1061573 [Coniochaeta sp. 2T2.1]